MNHNANSAKHLARRRFGGAGLSVGFGLLAAGLAACLLSSGCQQSEAPAATRQAGLPTSAAKPANATSATASPTSVQAAPTAQVTSVALANSTAAKRAMPPKDITFDTVKLKMAKDEPFRHELITPAIEHLAGSKIRIRGYILPPPQQTGLTRFVLVRDNMACCFGPGAAIYDSMIVDLQPGLAVDYKLQPIVVEGTFNVHEIRFPSGRYMSIYHLTADKAE